MCSILADVQTTVTKRVAATLAINERESTAACQMQVKYDKEWKRLGTCLGMKKKEWGCDVRKRDLNNEEQFNYNEPTCSLKYSGFRGIRNVGLTSPAKPSHPHCIYPG